MTAQDRQQLGEATARSNAQETAGWIASVIGAGLLLYAAGEVLALISGGEIVGWCALGAALLGTVDCIYVRHWAYTRGASWTRGNTLVSGALGCAALLALLPCVYFGGDVDSSEVTTSALENSVAPTSAVSQTPPEVTSQPKTSTLTTTNESSSSVDSSTSTAIAAILRSSLKPDERLAPGEFLEAADGSRLTMNLGQLQLTDSGGGFVWCTDIERVNSSAYVVMQRADGNLVVYRPSGEGDIALWKSEATGPGSRLVIEEGARLAIRDADGEELWSPEGGCR